jgi:hypothetical protein
MNNVQQQFGTLISAIGSIHKVDPGFVFQVIPLKLLSKKGKINYYN